MARGASKVAALALAACAAAGAVTSAADVAFHCVGNCDTPKPRHNGTSVGGQALMGGHMYPGVTVASDLEVYRWFLTRAGGGDVLVLTCDDAPCDVYNPLLLNGTHGGVPPNSVTTACFTGRSGAFEPRVAALLRGASGVFITGGDQSLYYRYWRDSPISQMLPSVPVVGGSSAGLAVQGQFVYDALGDSVESADVLRRPMGKDVTLTRSLFSLSPRMANVITDTHFAQRDRMGRLVGFLARVVHAGWATGGLALGVGISEHTAVQLDVASGLGTLWGHGPVFFLRTPGHAPEVCAVDEPLTFRGLSGWRWMPSGGAASPSVASLFNFSAWAPVAGSAAGFTPFATSAVDGRLVNSSSAAV